MARLISHIVLSVLLLISAAGLTVNLHYCESRLYDFALIVPADICYEISEHKNQCSHNSLVGNSDHCDDETIVVESTDEFVVSSNFFKFDNEHQINLFNITPIQLENLVTTENAVTGVLHYLILPLSKEVILSQIQSFLI